MNTRNLAGSLAASCALALLVIAACARPLVESDPERPQAAEDRVPTEPLVKTGPEIVAGPAVVETQRRVDVEAREAARNLQAPMLGSTAFYVQRPPAEEISRENYAHLDENPVHLASADPVSTFSVDVDTASYANLRRWLNAGRLPPGDAVRVEEMLNYFDYDYPAPTSRETPFRFSTALSGSPWNAEALLLRIGLKGYTVEQRERPPANLVFLVDVSGSMQSPGKLELLKQGLGLLVNQLDARDRISLVVYAGAAGIVLYPTPGDAKATIRAALSQLTAGGSTNGAAGIRQAYDLAQQAFIADGINRVILATDGDFNVGTVNFQELVDLVEQRRASGITLTTLGFGTGNYNDHLMEQLADKGNGNYAYIDTVNEARKVLVEEMSSTLLMIAKDVKAQIEFNPALVAEYRLVGYENRMLAREDFNNDKVDAGDIGAGHSVTALYEIVLNDSAARRIDPLRYGDAARARTAKSGELAFLKLRYKLPDENESRLVSQAIRIEDRVPFERTDDDFRFAAAVAAFGQHLRGGRYSGAMDYAAIRALADAARGKDRAGYRAEFVQLVALAEAVDPRDGLAAQARH